MCTNEAIAHFLMSDSAMREYTYLYLKCFEYDSLGNTSAISKAVNSKIIKGMPFVMPDHETVERFHRIAKPILDAIKDKQNMNLKLAEARDRLLPKLMNGEIEV
jgi:type I restriction enzyme S subunit